MLPFRFLIAYKGNILLLYMIKKRLHTNTTIWLLFGICWFVYFTSYIARLNFSSAMTAMIAEDVLNKTQAGFIQTAFFICYGCGQFLNGLLGDRLSPRRIVFWGLIISSITNFLMAYAPDYRWMALYWAINGYALSMIWPPIMRLFTDMLSEKSVVKCCVNITSSTAVGTLASYLLCAFLLQYFKWQDVFHTASFLLILVAALWLIIVRSLQKHCDKYGMVEDSISVIPIQKNKSPIIPLIFCSTTLIVFFPTIVHGTLKDGVTAWIPTYISETFSTSPSLSILSATILPLVNLSGVYAAQYLNKKYFKNEILCAGLFFLISLLGLGGLLLFGKYSIFLTILFFSIITSAMLGVNTLFVNLIPLHFRNQGRAATMSGLFNSLAYLGSAIATVVIGLLASTYGWGITLVFFALITAIAVIICIIGGKNKEINS